MLFAGTISISFKYFLLNEIVKKLKQRSKSAGNIINNYGTSETLRNETVISMPVEKIKSISEHVPRHLKPVTDDQFGHYLAGLIDGSGDFSSKQQLVIVFHSLDASLAYYIKKRVGFGSVIKVKEEKHFLLIIVAKKGIEKVIDLINGKIRTEKKFSQINKNILNHEKYLEFGKTINFKLNLSPLDYKNHWLAGFSDAHASFKIKIIERENRREIRLKFIIFNSQIDILVLIKEILGGNICYLKDQDTYYYCSTSFGSAKNVVNYFDYFHLLSSKHINYLKWRKAYLIIQAQSDKYHLNEEGKDKIIKLKNTMNRCLDSDFTS